MAEKSSPLAFQWAMALRRIEPIDAADHFVDRAEAELGHDLAQLFGQQEEVIDDVLRLAGEFLAQLGILRGDADRAGVQMALAHHDAADRHQGGGGDAPFLGAQHRGDRHVAGRAQLAVGLHDDPAAQIVEHQHLVRLGQAQFPGSAGVLDRGLRAGAGAAVVAADQHHVGLALGHAGGDGAHADFGHQLDAMRASRLAFFRSWINCDRSSIE